MAKIDQKKLVKAKHTFVWPLEKYNYMIILAGIVVIIIGYIALNSGGVEGTMPLVVAPILLILGYCVIIPIGIFYKKKVEKPEETPQA